MGLDLMKRVGREMSGVSSARRCLDVMTAFCFFFRSNRRK